MKVAVSIPDPIFTQVDVLAKRLKLSRSGVYARALDGFVANHAGSSTTETMNAAVDEAGEGTNSFARDAARRIFVRTEW